MDLFCYFAFHFLVKMLWRLLLLALSVSAEVPRIKLNNGREMPAIALGTYIGVAKDGKPKQENAIRDAVLAAIDLGYRHIDTAAIYGTETEIGEAVRMKIKEGKVSRGDVFITTKLWNTKHKREEVPLALRESLERLQTNYVDLYLIHWPFGLNNDYSFNDVDFMETWRGMEDAVRLGLARSIGLSNFNKEQVARVVREGSIKPAALQIEVHPQISQSELVSFCHSEGIAVMGYSPFGSLVQRYGMFFPGPRMEDPVFVDIAKKYGKTPAQVVLRWQVDRNIVPIPKSVNPKRLQENFNIFDFKLNEEEIASISAFDSNTMLILPSFWQEHRYYPFKKVENPMPDPFRA